ncbi:hypothetical protein [Thalassolituus hydrocarboniclasticus]|uniref:Exo-alpha-sialidase n=1 Tax=Thalassolituus hydrocarboniclasticus TaxID=2742796 RepID=A0ABY6A5P0_9GAMM|nr:hypothetical protein [Thalassolituus hydrocarboniclasticus]UXD85998.1 hypothetical protein HUF19_00380 [Thalassolituus hydrocarboniclasticus]
MKAKIIVAAIALTAAAQGHANSYTYYHAEDGSVTVERDIKIYSAGTQAISACIALPVTWDNELNTLASGTASEAIFSESLSVDTDATAAMNNNWSYSGFDWTCFSDTERTYIANEAANISFTFSPDVADMQVFTTLGFNDSDYLGMPYPRQISTHRLLQDAYVADHWMPLEDLPENATYSEPVLVGDAYYFLRREPDAESSAAAILRMDENGITPITDAPYTHELYYLNGKYISLTQAEEGSPEQGTVYISYSTDLQTWQAGANIVLSGDMELTGLYHNAVTGEYLAVSGDFSTSDFYSSSDFQSWSYSGAGPEDFYARYVSFANGNMLYMADGELYDTEFFIKAVGEASWTEIAPFPVDTPPTGETAGFLLYEYHQSSNGRLHVAGLYGYSGEYDYYWDEVIYGYTDNGVDWTWKTVPGEWLDTYEEVGEVLINDSVLLVSSIETQEFYLSRDGGENWSTVSSSLLFDGDWNMPEGVVIEPEYISVAGDRFYIRFSFLIPSGLSSGSFYILGYADVSTTDFASFRLEGLDSRDTRFMALAGNNSFREQGGLSWRDGNKYYRYGVATIDSGEPETPEVPTENPSGGSSSGGSSGGSFWWLNLLLLPLVFTSLLSGQLRGKQQRAEGHRLH